MQAGSTVLHTRLIQSGTACFELALPAIHPLCGRAGYHSNSELY